MSPDEIKRHRKLLSDKAAALKELMEIGEIDYDAYSQEIAKIQIERRKLKNANVIDVEVVSIENDRGTPEIGDNLPVVIENDHWNDEPMERPRRRDYPPEPPPSLRRDSELDNNPQRRCTAKRTNGKPCRKWAIQGGNVCATHGGKAIQVVQKARIRVQNHADKLMRTELEFAYDETKDANVRLKAVQDALNRAGLQPISVVQVGAIKPHEEIMADLEFGTMTRAESRAARGIEDSDPNVIGPQSHTPPAPASPNSGVEGRQPNYIDYQGDSNAQNEYGIQSDKPPYAGPAPTVGDDGPIPRPSHQQHHERPPGAKWGPVVVGDDAIVLANATNAAIGALRALPPGRSG